MNSHMDVELGRKEEEEEEEAEAEEERGWSRAEAVTAFFFSSLPPSFVKLRG